jgi:hypothetical protein
MPPGTLPHPCRPPAAPETDLKARGRRIGATEPPAGPGEEVRHMTIEIRTLDKVETTDQCANN